MIVYTNPKYNINLYSESINEIVNNKIKKHFSKYLTKLKDDKSPYLHP